MKISEIYKVQKFLMGIYTKKELAFELAQLQLAVMEEEE